MPETEIPPVLRGDFYFILMLAEIKRNAQFVNQPYKTNIVQSDPSIAAAASPRPTGAAKNVRYGYKPNVTQNIFYGP